MSLSGIVVFFCLLNQLVSGTMLSFSYIPEPMLTPFVRDEEDLEVLFIDELW